MKRMGTTVGPYRLLEMLGHGGMGLVYRARHWNDGQIVALKTVQVPRASQIQSLRREIHALSRLSHPGVVCILDEGVEQGLPWYAMELIEGGDLRRTCQKVWDPGQVLASEAPTDLVENLRGWKLPAMSPEEAPRTRRGLEPEALREVLGLVRGLCEALAYLHGEGIVHRDLKPGNVLVQPAAGSLGRPVLVDFGLTRRFTGALGREALDGMTGSGGTASYMAPEHHQPILVDPRTDLYSLGCILYELLTGRPPFVGATAAAVLWQHGTAEPLRPSQLVPEIPAAIDELVLRLLAKWPAGRPGYAEDVARALEAAGAPPGLESSAPRPRAYLYRPRLAGREAALSELQASLTGFLRGAKGGCVLLSGESGIGKTRLALEATRELDPEEIRLLSGQCVAITTWAAETSGQVGGPLHPLRRSLQAIADHCREGGVEETAELLGHRGPLLGQYEPAFADLPGLEDQPEPGELPAVAARLRLFLYLTEVYGAFGRKAPVLLVLDDLQWADDLSVGLLAYLLKGGRLERLQLFLVGICRTGEMGQGLSTALAGSGALRMEIGRLGIEAVQGIVQDMLAAEAPPPGLVRFLWRYSEGNPFFVAEYLRAAVEEGVLRRDEQGRWQVAQADEESDYEALAVPVTVRSLLGRRLERLGAGARLLARTAAVAGREVGWDLLAQATGLEPDAMLEATQELLVAQFVEELDEARLRFAHDKVREVIYEALSPVELKQRHGDVARVLAKEIPEAPVPERLERLAALGLHWERASEPARARECYLAAARQARQEHALGEAERLYRAYLRLVEDPTAESVKVRNELGQDVLRVQGRGPEAIAEELRALADAHALHDLGAEAATLRSLGNVEWSSGRPEEARAHFEQALELAREIGDRALEGITLGNLAVVHQEQGRLEMAFELYEKALQLHRELGNRRFEGITLSNLAVIHHEQGHLEQAQSLYESALEVHRALRNQRFETVTLGNMADVARGQGRAREALAIYREALGLAREVGERRSEGHLLGNMAQAFAELGQWDEARGYYVQSLALIRDCGDRRLEGAKLACRATMERWTGRLDEAEKLAAEAEQALREVGDALYLAVCLCERGHLELARGGSGARPLAEALELAGPLRASGQSELGLALARLHRAVRAAAAGQPALVCGQLDVDFPKGLRRWLMQRNR